jgi:hypothetical protein
MRTQSMSSQAQHPRRIVFIKKAFQGRFIALVLLLIAAFGVLSAALIFWLVGGDLDAQSQAAHVSIAAVRERLSITILLCNVVAAISAGCIATFVVLYTTHRIAGPLYRFETLCRQVADGKLDGVTHLRDKDQLQDLAVAFSAMVTKLQERHDQRASLAAALDQQLQSLEAAGLPEAQRTRVTAMRAQLVQLTQTPG